MLALCLVIVLAAVGWIALGGWNDEADFEEGVGRMESAMRLARADAANAGLRIRMSFDANGNPSLTYEPNPLTAPGQFVDYVGCAWGDVISSGKALVSRCELTGSSAYQSASQPSVLSPTVAWAATQPSTPRDQPPMDSLTFYPDGSVDSALVELKPPADSDMRRAVIELGGMDGAINTLMTDVDSLSDTYLQIYLTLYPDANSIAN
jgi:hypothetical protein